VQQLLKGELSLTILGQSGAVQILLDPAAGGYGWFIDAGASESDAEDGLAHRVDPDSVPPGRIDLFTVIAHELGHVLGLADLDPVTHPDALMAGELPPGIRKFPTAADLLGPRTATTINPMGPPLLAASASLDFHGTELS
jgi:hypothetical protein